MPQTIEVKPGADWQKLVTSNLTLIFLDGEHAPGTIPKVSKLRMQAANRGKAILDGDLGNGRHSEFTVRVNDGCSDVTLDGLGITGGQHGFKATMGTRVGLTFCRCFENGVEGAIWGGGDGGFAEDCEFDHNGAFRVTGYNPDQGWGCYFSWGIQNPRMLRCHVHDNPAGSQWNSTAEQGRPIIHGAHISEVVFERNGSGGTGALSVISIADFLFEKMYFEGNAGIVTFFSTGGPPCEDGVMRDFTDAGDNGWGIRQNDVRNVSVSPGAGWSPDTPPVPPDPPTPPTDPCAAEKAQVAALTAQVASLTAEREAAAAWYSGAPSWMRGEV